MQKPIEEMTNDEILTIYDEHETDDKVTAEVFRRFRYYVQSERAQGDDNADTTYMRLSECQT